MRHEKKIKIKQKKMTDIPERKKSQATNILIMWLLSDILIKNLIKPTQ